MAVPLHRTLADLAKLRKEHGSLQGSTVASLLRAEKATDLLSLLPGTGNVAVLGDADDPRAPMTHQELRQLVQGLQLHKMGILPGVRVGVIVNNGPELAVLLVALLTSCSVVPINSAGSLEEFTSEIVATGVDLLITDDADSQRLAALCVLAGQLPLPLLVLSKDSEKAGAFKLAHAYKVMTTYDDCISTSSNDKLNTEDSKPALSIEVVVCTADEQLEGAQPTTACGSPGSPQTFAISGGHVPPRQFTKFVSFGRIGTMTGTPAASSALLEGIADAAVAAADAATPADTVFADVQPTADSAVAAVAAAGWQMGADGSTATLRKLRSIRSIRKKMSGRFEGAPGMMLLGTSGLGSAGKKAGAGEHWHHQGAAGGLNSLDDHALILQTSGSTGSKKVVPYTLEAVLVGSICIAASMELGPGDMAVNMMPLFHSGGIFRNVLAPLLSGGSTCCMALFDAMQFWQVVQSKPASWYYASPTMHMGILEALTFMEQSPSHRIRLIANAAGPLLPATAEKLKSTFRGATIMPGYGMTECMPISAPPPGYCLDRPGSSGLPLGPLLRIANEQGVELPRSTIGEIMVQGLPLFQGYDHNPSATAEAFVQGWFKTGDLGYQDEDGYLFITGRSKDVINRGGEIISPAEVESAVVQMPGLRGAAAFPVGHDKLQEAVGLVLVPEAGSDVSKWPLLPEVTSFLSGVLHPSKWPFMVVYMPDLPKGPTGKVVRTGLAKRLGLPEFNDKTSMQERHYQAEAPAPSAPVSSKIPASLMTGIEQQLAERCGSGGSSGGFRAPANWLEKECVGLVAQVVGLEPSKVSAEDDFFLIGGSSMNASQLAALLRRKFMLSCTGLTIFSYRSPAELAAHILEQKPHLQQDGWLDSAAISKGTRLPSLRSSKNLYGVSPPAAAVVGGKVPDPSLKPHVLLMQLLPVACLAPLRRICTWMLFFFLWFVIGNAFLVNIGPGGQRNLWALLLALVAMRLVRSLVVPWLGIAAKWTIVGRYKAGRYPLWGSMYMRWWMVDKILHLTGRGCFEWTPGLLRTYCRLMGAKVGKGVAISSGAHLREYDLLCLGDSAVVDCRAYLRPFAADNGQMLLAPITIGRDACVCVNGVVPPGSSLPDGSAVGPNGCSLEQLGTAEQYRRFCQVDFPGPPLWLQLLVGHPIIAAAKLAALAPIVVLLLVVLPAAHSTSYPFTSWQNVVQWLVDPAKLMIYLLAAICYAGICPFIYLAMVILIKRTIIGKFTPGPRGGSAWQLLRHWLMSMLLPDGSLGHTLWCLGAHWEPVSMIYRALGAKIGKRIFWPGGGLHGVVQYDCLSIEDDAVFGSRSTYMIADAEEVVPITIKAGGNVADRCTLLPGATVGVNACLGTGGVLGKNQHLEAGAVAVGCQGGSAVVITPGSAEAQAAPTLKPFGKAQYLGEASYWLPHDALWVAMNWFVVVAAGVFNRSKMIVCWTIVYLLLDLHRASEIVLAQFFGTLLGVYTAINAAYTLSSLVVFCIASKWAIIGLRKPGAYGWDTHPYCAKWQVYIALMAFRGDIMDLLGGSAYIVWYFRALGCKIGRAVCLYPAGSDPMMNEPELVSIGDNACINHAFVVNHINTKGNFSLERTVIGKHTTLRAFARLMAGGTMEDGSVMLEHTLALPGETVDTGIAWQGWPVNTVVPAKVLRMQEAQTAAAAAAKDQGLTGLTSLANAAAPAPGSSISPAAHARHKQLEVLASVDLGTSDAATAAVNRDAVNTEGVLSRVATMRLRKSLRISGSMETRNTAELMEHLGSIEHTLAVREEASMQQQLGCS